VFCFLLAEDESDDDGDDDDDDETDTGKYTKYPFCLDSEEGL